MSSAFFLAFLIVLDKVNLLYQRCMRTPIYYVLLSPNIASAYDLLVKSDFFTKESSFCCARLFSWLFTIQRSTD